MSLRAVFRSEVAFAAAIALLLSSSAVASTAEFAIAPGTSNRGIGDSLGLDFRDGVLRAAWGDNSAELAGNPDPPSSELAFRTVTVGADGSIALGPAVNASRAAGDQVGGSLAVNPTNPDNLVAVANSSSGCCDVASFRAYSFDGGATWTGRSDLPGAINGSAPQVAFDGHGNLFLALVDQTVFEQPRLRLYLSTDGGVTLSEISLPARSDLDSSPSLATAPGAVWVAFVRYDGVARVGAFSAPVTGLGGVGAFTLQTAPGSAGARVPDIAVGPAGQALVAYEARPWNGFNVVNVQLDADGAGPGGFAAAVPVANIGAYGSLASPRLVYDAGGRASVVYRDQELRPDTQDVLLQLSDDDGATWSAARRVNEDVASPRRLVPDVVAERGTSRVAVAWFDGRAGDFRLFGRVFDSVSPPATPLSPLNLSATPVSQSGIDLAWTDRSGNETGFEITRTSAGGVRTLFAGPDATSFSDTGLAANTQYRYVVRAVNGAGRSTGTNEAAATTLDTPPATPTNLVAVGGAWSNRIELTWDASARATGYEIHQSTAGGPFVHVQNSSTNAATIYFLEPGIVYSFKVRAFNSGGFSDFSNIATSTTELRPPAAATDLTAVAVASYRIDLAWTDRSPVEDRFDIAESRNGKSFRVVATVHPNATSFSRYGLRASTTYRYQVRACNAAGCSAWSNTATATTPAG